MHVLDNSAAPEPYPGRMSIRMLLVLLPLLCACAARGPLPPPPPNADIPLDPAIKPLTQEQEEQIAE